MAGPAHVFYEAVEHGADYELEFLQIEKGVASTSSGLNFARLIPFRKSNLQKGDMLFIPGFDTEYLFDHSTWQNSHPFLSGFEEHMKAEYPCAQSVQVLLFWQKLGYWITVIVLLTGSILITLKNASPKPVYNGIGFSQMEIISIPVPEYLQELTSPSTSLKNTWEANLPKTSPVRWWST